MKSAKMFNQSIFYRFLLTYTVILIFPVFILTIFHYRYSVNEIEKNVLRDKRRSLEMSGELIDTQLSHLEKIVLQMGFSSEFKPFLFDEDPFEVYKLIRVIRNYTYTNSFSEKMYVYFEGDAYVYTNLNAELLETFAASAFPEDSRFDPTRKMDESVLFISNEDKLVIVYPLPAGLPRVAYGKVFFSISKDLLLGYFLDTDTQHEIVDLNGQRIFFSPGVHPVRDDDIVIEYKSTNRITFVERIPRRSFSRDMIRYRNIYLAVIGAIILVSIPLIYIFSLSQTNPIRKLSNFVRQATGLTEDSGGDRTNNELQLIHDNIDDYIRKTNPVVKTQLILDLLNGKIAEAEQIPQRYRKLRLCWGSTLHTVCILRTEDGSEISNDAAAQIAARYDEERIPGFGEVLVYNPPQENEIVFILGFECVPTVSDITALLSDTVPFRWIIGCGSSRESPEALNKAYSEARYALEYCQLSGSAPVVFFHEIAGIGHVPVAGELHLLEKAFESENPRKIETELGKLEELMHEGALSLFQIRMYYYELLNLAVKINEKWKCPDTFQIEDIENVEEILRLIKEIVKTAIQNREDVEIPDFITRMQVFIEENISNNLLSLELLSEQFNLSTSYISRSFKKFQGENFSSHICKLRINKCKELLRNSELSISDIITNIGYSDPSNFIRMFRKHEGLTPGEYRQSFFRR